MLGVTLSPRRVQESCKVPAEEDDKGQGTNASLHGFFSTWKLYETISSKTRKAFSNTGGHSTNQHTDWMKKVSYEHLPMFYVASAGRTASGSWNLLVIIVHDFFTESAKAKGRSLLRLPFYMQFDGQTQKSLVITTHKDFAEFATEWPLTLRDRKFSMVTAAPAPPGYFIKNGIISGFFFINRIDKRVVFEPGRMSGMKPADQIGLSEFIANLAGGLVQIDVGDVVDQEYAQRVFSLAKQSLDSGFPYWDIRFDPRSPERIMLWTEDDERPPPPNVVIVNPPPPPTPVRPPLWKFIVAAAFLVVVGSAAYFYAPDYWRELGEKILSTMYLGAIGIVVVYVMAYLRARKQSVCISQKAWHLGARGNSYHLVLCSGTIRALSTPILTGLD